MREILRRPTLLPPAWMPVLLGLALLPAAASGQAPEPHRSWAVVPMLGFGVVRDGEWGSAGMEAALELEYGGSDWRWNGHGSVRGLGVSCSHARAATEVSTCFDGGPAVAVGGMRSLDALSLGALWIGAGAGVMKQFGEWRLVPYGRISLDAAPLRIETRVEFPQFDGMGPYVPILIGIPIPRSISR